MLGANVLVRKPFRFFRGVGQNPFAFVAEREVNRSRDLLPDCGVSFDLLADGFDRSMRTQESVGQGFVFAQKSQQQVLSLNIRRPELAGFIARKKDHAPCFFRITFKHKALPPWLSQGPQSCACGRPLGNHWPQDHYAIKLPPRLWPVSAVSNLVLLPGSITKET